MTGIPSRPDPDDAAADVIRRLRRRHGLSQRQISEMLGVGLRTLQRWESGAQTPPAYLARALRDLSRELSRDDDGSLASLVDEYAYVRLIARLAHRARTRGTPDLPTTTPPSAREARLASGALVPCHFHADDVVELGEAAAGLGVGDEIRVGERVARVTELAPVPPHHGGRPFRVVWLDQESREK